MVHYQILAYIMIYAMWWGDAAYSNLLLLTPCLIDRGLSGSMGYAIKLYFSFLGDDKVEKKSESKGCGKWWDINMKWVVSSVLEKKMTERAAAIHFNVP